MMILYNMPKHLIDRLMQLAKDMWHKEITVKEAKEILKEHPLINNSYYLQEKVFNQYGGR